MNHLINVSFLARTSKVLCAEGYRTETKLIAEGNESDLPEGFAEKYGYCVVSVSLPSWLTGAEYLKEVLVWNETLQAVPADWSEALVRALKDNTTMALSSVRFCRRARRFPDNAFFVSLSQQVEGWLVTPVRARKYNSPLSLAQSDAGSKAYAEIVTNDVARFMSGAKRSVTREEIVQGSGHEDNIVWSVVNRLIDRGVVGPDVNTKYHYDFNPARFYGGRKRTAKK